MGSSLLLGVSPALGGVTCTGKPLLRDAFAFAACAFQDYCCLCALLAFAANLACFCCVCMSRIAFQGSPGTHFKDSWILSVCCTCIITIRFNAINTELTVHDLEQLAVRHAAAACQCLGSLKSMRLHFHATPFP